MTRTTAKVVLHAWLMARCNDCVVAMSLRPTWILIPIVMVRSTRKILIGMTKQAGYPLVTTLAAMHLVPYLKAMAMSSATCISIAPTQATLVYLAMRITPPFGA